ncbi:aminoglycoside phosphotransferase family protein [Ruegeria atlantica]|uniref:aminoglycoside phosphotransferase family protein n=1 Tax=Ruegeria atlantica TaxID=81569 RepID=UPI00249501A0|nr:aminoglycoside phosphotransferase family protein [Ruegeria atlantica]
MQNALNEFLTRWDLEDPQLVADTGHAHVWKVRTLDNTLAALKIYRRPNRGNEADGPHLMHLWRGRGAVHILAETPNAVLSEWLEGPSLGDIARSGRPDEAVRGLATAADRLHQSPTINTTGLKPLQEVFAPILDCQFSDDCPTRLRRDMMQAINIGRHLLDTQDMVVPLHGDLHHDNVIATPAGHRVFDAKGYIGDPAFELANALRHPKGMPELVRRPEQIETGLALYATAMRVNEVRLAQWAAAKCALSIFWRADGTVTNDPEEDLLNLLLQVADQ